MDKTSSKYWTLCIYLALALATLTAFWQVQNYDFVNYDDGHYVSKNQHVKAGLTRDSVRWAFTTGHVGNWHPLTWLSHMLDCQLFGTAPGRHHLTNLLLHLTNTLLLFAVLKRMTHGLWCSAFVAAAFALHPLHVESVAWIAERKDVLSGFFWILTMWAYVRYAERRSVSRYLLTLLAFALGLMAKPMLVTLPFILLLLDYWPLGRFQLNQAAKDIDQWNHKSVATQFQWRLFIRLVREKVPFFALTVASSVITFIVQQRGGAVQRIELFPLNIRLSNAVLSYVKYIGKMFWPSRLAMFYPHPIEAVSVWQAAAAALLLLAISIWVIRLVRRRRYLLVGWLWYMGTLVPVIGLVQVGEQAMADRYTYIPLTGLFIIIAWGVRDILTKWRYRKVTASALALVILLALSISTHLQQRHWRNSITLCEHALEVTENNYVAHFCMTESLQKQHRLDEAIYHNAEAIRIEPDFVEALNGMGLALLDAGRLDEAVTHFTRALEICPNLIAARINLGVAFVKKGNFNEAIKQYNEARRIRPDLADVYSHLGYALARQGKLTEAAEEYYEAIKRRPDNPGTHKELADILVRQGEIGEAIKHYTQALRIEPNFPEAHTNLGFLLARQGKLDEAIEHHTEALRIEPHFAQAQNNLGNALFLQGRFDEAITHFIEALRIKPDFAEAHNDLGVVLVRLGRLDEAAMHFAEALRIKPDFAKAKNNLDFVLPRLDKLDKPAQPQSEPVP